jgi:hypothetical protein
MFKEVATRQQLQPSRVITTRALHGAYKNERRNSTYGRLNASCRTTVGVDNVYIGRPPDGLSSASRQRYVGPSCFQRKSLALDASQSLRKIRGTPEQSVRYSATRRAIGEKHLRLFLRHIMGFDKQVVYNR